MLIGSHQKFTFDYHAAFSIIGSRFSTMENPFFGFPFFGLRFSPKDLNVLDWQSS